MLFIIFRCNVLLERILRNEIPIIDILYVSQSDQIREFEDIKDELFLNKSSRFQDFNTKQNKSCFSDCYILIISRSRFVFLFTFCLSSLQDKVGITYLFEVHKTTLDVIQVV